VISIRWSKLGADDRDCAFRDALATDPDYAEALVDALEHAQHFLANTPFAGSPVFDSERRKWRLGRLPYALIYRVDGNRLFVIRLVHLRSDWQALP
jgi:toxin ParE1/3/4